MKNQMLTLAALAALALPGCAEAQAPAKRVEARKPFASNRIAVTVRGSGPDVVLIHGLNGSAAVWDGTVKAVPGYRYHLVQIAGFAGAPPRGNATGKVVAPVAAEVARYIAEKGLRKPAVIGHSMGGVIALMLASRYPARVGKAMVVDITPDAAGLVGLRSAALKPVADTLLGLLATPEGQSLFDRFDNGRSTSDRGVTSRALHELATTDLTPELPRIAAPLTVVYATPPGDPQRAAAVQRSYGRSYAGAKGAKLVRVANSGHMVMYDKPGEFGAAVRAFLK